MKINKFLLSILLTLLFLFFPTNSFATSGCCSWHGGQSYCDYSTGRWVCNDGTYSPSCTCGGGYSGYQANPTPSCPLYSYYDNISSSCKCYSGYVSNGNSCISLQQYCWNTLGYSSTYNYGTNSCECSYSNVLNGGKCVSGSTYCWNNYGYNSSYNSLSKKCECNYGYVWNTQGSKCISRDESCHNQLGIMSRYNTLNNTCECFSGYIIKNGQCQFKDIETEHNIFPYVPKSYTTLTNTPIPTNIISTITKKAEATVEPNIKNDQKTLTSSVSPYLLPTDSPTSGYSIQNSLKKFWQWIINIVT